MKIKNKNCMKIQALQNYTLLCKYRQRAKKLARMQLKYWIIYRIKKIFLILIIKQWLTAGHS